MYRRKYVKKSYLEHERVHGKNNDEDWKIWTNIIFRKKIKLVFTLSVLMIQFRAHKKDPL